MFALGVSWGGLGLGGKKMEDSSDRARNGHQHQKRERPQGPTFKISLKQGSTISLDVKP